MRGWLRRWRGRLRLSRRWRPRSPGLVRLSGLPRSGWPRCGGDAAREQAELRAGLEAQIAVAEEARAGLVARVEQAEGEAGQARSAVGETDARLAEAVAGKAAAEQEVAAAESGLGRLSGPQRSGRPRCGGSGSRPVGAGSKLRRLRLRPRGRGRVRGRRERAGRGPGEGGGRVRRHRARRSEGGKEPTPNLDDARARPAARQQLKATTRSRRSRGPVSAALSASEHASLNEVGRDARTRRARRAVG